MRERENPSLLLSPFLPNHIFYRTLFPLHPPTPPPASLFFHENFFPPHLLSFPLTKPGLINRGGKGSNLLFQSVCFYASLHERASALGYINCNYVYQAICAGEGGRVF